MAPTILVAGATGNTGQSVMHLLPKLLDTSKNLKSFRILGLTRDVTSATAKELKKIPHVQMIEKDWTDIDIQWMKDNEIVRVFLAAFNTLSAFALEANFLNNARLAGVKYVVRISTTPANVAPESKVYYGRTHWAIENLLSQPEFKDLQWTSLQPNVFTNTYFMPCLNWLQKYRETGKQEPLGFMADETAPVAVIDPSDVGELAAHLLAQDDIDSRNQGRLCINGPENITGKQIVDILGEQIGEKVEKVKFKDMSFLDALRQNGDLTELAIRSIALAPVLSWEGKCSVETMPTSRAVMDLAPPQRKASQVLKQMLKAA